MIPSMIIKTAHAKYALSLAGVGDAIGKALSSKTVKSIGDIAKDVGSTWNAISKKEFDISKAPEFFREGVKRNVSGTKKITSLAKPLETMTRNIVSPWVKDKGNGKIGINLPNKDMLAMMGTNYVMGKLINPRMSMLDVVPGLAPFRAFARSGNPIDFVGTAYNPRIYSLLRDKSSPLKTKLLRGGGEVLMDAYNPIGRISGKVKNPFMRELLSQGLNTGVEVGKRVYLPYGYEG